MTSLAGLGVEICEGSWHADKPLVKKTQEYRYWLEREKVLIARELLESLAKLPSHYCQKDSQKLYLESVITSRTNLNKVFQEYCDSIGKLRVSRQVLLKEMKMQNIAIYTNQKKISAICVLDINMALSPNSTSGSMKREKKSQDRKRRMINRRSKETITSWFSPWTFRWSCWLHVYLQCKLLQNQALLS